VYTVYNIPVIVCSISKSVQGQTIGQMTPHTEFTFIMSDHFWNFLNPANPPLVNISVIQIYRFVIIL